MLQLRFLVILLAFFCQHFIFCDEVTSEDTWNPGGQEATADERHAEEGSVEVSTEEAEEGAEVSQLPAEAFLQEALSEMDTEVSAEAERVPVPSGSSKAVTLQDILTSLDKDAPLPPHLQLSFAHSANISAVKKLTSNMTAELRRITCRERKVYSANLTDFVMPMVKIVSSKEFLKRLNSSVNDSTQANCFVVLFYAPWCPFCAKVAPHFNALPRVFPRIDFVAIDAIKFNTLNARFGTIAVPNLLFFHNSKIVRFNATVRTVDAMANFIHNITNLEYNSTSLRLYQVDFLGPLSSIPSHDRDQVLWLSWLVILSCCAYMFSRSEGALRLWNYVNSFGAVHEHQHID